MLATIWAWLDGNKTIIGTLILTLLGMGFISDQTFLYEFLMWFGGILAGGGVAHKLIKGTSNTGK